MTLADTRAALPHTPMHTRAYRTPMYMYVHLRTAVHIRVYPQTPAHTPYIPANALNLIIHMKLHVNTVIWKKGEIEREMKKEGTRVRWGNQQTKNSNNTWFKHSYADYLHCTIFLYLARVVPWFSIWWIQNTPKLSSCCPIYSKYYSKTNGTDWWRLVWWIGALKITTIIKAYPAASN